MENPFTLANITLFIGEISVFASAIIPIVAWIRKLAAGSRCQMRNDMLQIYYRYEESKEIPQYQYENFVAMYEAYKALKGNSFVDKIYSDIQDWEIIANNQR